MLMTHSGQKYSLSLEHFIHPTTDQENAKNHYYAWQLLTANLGRKGNYNNNNTFSTSKNVFFNCCWIFELHFFNLPETQKHLSITNSCTELHKDKYGHGQNCFTANSKLHSPFYNYSNSNCHLFYIMFNLYLLFCMQPVTMNQQSENTFNQQC